MHFLDHDTLSQVVLVVEDESAVLNFIKYVLEKNNYQVLVAGNSVEAVLLAAEYPGVIQLLLTDVEMKIHRNGLELAACFNVMRPETRILCTSGSPLPLDSRTCDAFKSQWGFLPKPFTQEQLLEKVGHELAREAVF